MFYKLWYDLSVSGVFVDGNSLVDEAMSATIDVYMSLIAQPKS